MNHTKSNLAFIQIKIPLENIRPPLPLGNYLSLHVRDYVLSVHNGTDLIQSRVFSFMEKKFFRYCHKVYVAKGNMRRCEFWSISLLNNEQIILGTLVDGVFERVDEFYKLPWDVQKGAERLFIMAREFWQTFIIDYENRGGIEYDRMIKKRYGKFDLKAATTVQKYRKAGVTFRDIAKILDKSVKSIYRLNKYQLSTHGDLRQ